MIERRRYMGLTALPYDYEVEYLESTGTQWIDTGYYPKKHLTEIEERHKQGSGYTWGCRWDGYSYTVGVWRDVVYFFSGYSRKSETEYTVKIANGEVYVNGTLWFTYNSVQEVTAPYPIYLFAWNTNGIKQQQGTERLYFFKVSENGLAILDLIPVVKDNTGYMYDKVSGQLFGNNGTDNFIVGPRLTGGGKHLIIRMLPTFAERRWAA